MLVQVVLVSHAEPAVALMVEESVDFEIPDVGVVGVVDQPS